MDLAGGAWVGEGLPMHAAACGWGGQVHTLYELAFACPEAPTTGFTAMKTGSDVSAKWILARSAGICVNSCNWGRLAEVGLACHRQMSRPARAPTSPGAVSGAR